jgi:hypothetical protein
VRAVQQDRLESTTRTKLPTPKQTSGDAGLCGGEALGVLSALVEVEILHARRPMNEAIHASTGLDSAPEYPLEGPPAGVSSQVRAAGGDMAMDKGSFREHCHEQQMSDCEDL